ncbi:hypothetical protein [Arsenophonus nasoniae]|uniref:Uncharacterized protein n=1 Tax=Arsenophonus nasoniae TaxID=638 RepID=A0AA95K2J3_9GAMM|nr:hypothetical protein [Arsenophonus nasoniae]WGL97021.1 hypothetical protein QE207_04095 [Arsenophonus nasoniae]
MFSTGHQPDTAEQKHYCAPHANSYLSREYLHLVTPAKANDEKIVIVNLLILRWLASGFGFSFSRYFPSAKRFTTLDCKTLTSLLNLLRHLTAMSAKSAIHIAHLLLAFIGLINRFDPIGATL